MKDRIILSAKDRARMIEYIERTYPAEDIELGKRFLAEARAEFEPAWQDESDAVLHAYYDKCVGQELALTIQLDREDRAIAQRCARFGTNQL